MLAKIKRLFEWLFTRNASRNFRKKAIEFEYVWIIILGLWIFALLSSWSILRVVAYVAIILLALLFMIRPMNAVYGLMGTSGSIRLFFFNFLFITFLFACIYQGGFFKHAGISYDVNQPHVDYNYYAHKSSPDIVQSDTLVYKKRVGSIWNKEVVVQETRLNYQPITFWFTWRNSIMTTLMQEPTEFFSVASTYNESMADPSLSPEDQLREISHDKQKSEMFQWVLIVQVLISWIFFGVFISLLYNKFRYES